MLNWFRSLFSSQPENENAASEDFSDIPDIPAQDDAGIESQPHLALNAALENTERSPHAEEFVVLNLGDLGDLGTVVNFRYHGHSRITISARRSIQAPENNLSFLPIFEIFSQLLNMPRENSLAALAGEEGATKPLNQEQKTALLQLEEKYASQLKAKGRENLLREIKAYLSEQFLKSVSDSKINLPLRYSPPLSEEQKRLYYQNIYHVAIRYLFWEPNNPLISPKACWVKHHRYGASADIQDYDLTILINLWLAIHDPALVLKPPMTREDVLLEYVKLLDELGRGHNRDKERVNARGKKERYDDLEGDKPICRSGLTQRSTQFLMLYCDHILACQPLNEDMIRNSIKERIIAKMEDGSGLFDRLEKLEIPRLREIEQALKQLIINNGDEKELTPRERKILKEELHIPEKARENLFAFYKNYYGEDRIKKPSSQTLRHFEEKFSSYEGLINYILNNVCSVYYGEISEKIGQRIASLEQENQAFSLRPK